MKNILSISAVFLLITAFITANPGIDGKWIGKINSPNGEVEIEYNFNIDADTLTGTVVGGMGEIEILNGEVNGSEFSFDTSFNGFTISHQCELTDENKITMEFTFEEGGPGGPQGPQEIILTRATEE